MQNIQAIPSENVLSGIWDFRLHLINLQGRRWKSLMDFDRLGEKKKEHVVTEKLSAFLKTNRE